MSFLTPEEMILKRRARKKLMYATLFIFTIAIIAGTTVLAYNM
ncbi:hypothetical protein ANABIO32_17530 [Rossellomorea marisflavi]|nr:hypothetical protein [Rossellomorea marisflavi]MDR4935235.1 hypothetical protein [Rossellomorea marisflavi]GLI84055.1 hypothetical protein ANABIO32_17530 [Rossellomorea marisflavi]